MSISRTKYLEIAFWKHLRITQLKRKHKAFADSFKDRKGFEKVTMTETKEKCG